MKLKGKRKLKGSIDQAKNKVTNPFRSGGASIDFKKGRGLIDAEKWQEVVYTM